MESIVAKSKQTIKILNTLRLSKNIPVNILVVGEIGTGKKTLIKYVFENANFLSIDEISNLKDFSKELFIDKFNEISNLKYFMNKIKNSRIIATSNEYKEDFEEFFPVILHLPPLKKREEDLNELKRLFIQKAKKELEIDEIDDNMPIDLSKNIISLKKSIYINAVLKNMDENKIMSVLEEYFSKQENLDYKKMLPLFEISLIKAAQKRYKSTLAMSKALNLNRATLRTKLQKYKII